MSEEKFTPSPWKLETKRDICDEYFDVISPLGLFLHDKISDVDAALIVKSPELYRAVQKSVSMFKALRSWLVRQEKTGSCARVSEVIDEFEKLLKEARNE